MILEESTLGVPLTVSPCSAVILEESTPSTLIRRQAQVNMKLQYFCTKKNYTSPPIRYVVYSPTHCIAYMIKFLFVAADPCDHNPCGPNEVCGDAGQVATCSCDEGYVGSPPLCIPSTSKYIFISGWVENTKMWDFLKTTDRFHG